MALAPYKDKQFLYEYYVRKRMNLTDIVDLLKTKYNLKVTPQTVYNWCKRYDLLKYRGKGRNLSVSNRRSNSPLTTQAKRMRDQKKQRAMKNSKKRKF